MRSSGVLHQLSCIALLVPLPAAGPTPIHPRASIITRGDQYYSCKCYEGEDCWPAAEAWDALNSIVGGALQRVLPAAAVCHESFRRTPTYNEEACSSVTANLNVQLWWVNQTVDTMWTYWSNNTCLATERNSTCTIGFNPDYVIIATEKDHIKAGVDFARDNNLRLLIRNTGHDFMGRSNAYGALAINTHRFKDVTFVDDFNGFGSAVTIGAGIQLRELYTLAHAQDPPLLIMGGECPTVGIAGGYIQGGGHGILGSWYGMAADNALSFDIVSAEGEFVTASATGNPDLFWSLKGGGPSSFGVVVSVTLRTHPNIRAAGTILNINSTHTNDSSLAWRGIEIFHSRANEYTDHGMFVYYEIFGSSLYVQPFVAPGMSAAELQQALKSLFEELDAARVPYSTVTKEFDSVYDLYIDMFEDEGGNANSYIGGRIFTRSDISERNAAILDSHKITTTPAPGYVGGIVGHLVGPGHNKTDIDNAIHPIWREASSFSIAVLNLPQTLSWEQRLEAEDLLTNVIGTDWQESYWGSKYPRLLETRRKWDRHGVFYARTTPGTEDWEVIYYYTRLCKRVG